MRQGITLANRVRRHRASTGIAEESVDLVTSSMLVSQFEFEPYRYFSRQVADVLGRPTPRENRRLKPAIETLRSTLLANQLEGHCDEIERSLAPRGWCFMSFQMFHFDDRENRWFLVEEMHQALALLARRFRFDIDIVPEHGLATRYDGASGASVDFSLVLEPKPR